MPVKKGAKGMADCMHEFKAGELNSGKGGPIVTSRSQALAICLRASGTGKANYSPPKGKK